MAAREIARQLRTIETTNLRGCCVNVKNLALVEAEFNKTLAHVDGAVPDLDKVEPSVLRELEELPLLLLDDLFAGNSLLDVLLLLNGRQPRALRVPCSRALRKWNTKGAHSSSC